MNATLEISKSNMAKFKKSGIVLHVLAFIIGLITIIITIGIAITGEAASAIQVFLVFGVISAVYIMLGSLCKNMAKRFEIYIALISEQQVTSLEGIAIATGRPVGFVSNDLKLMIKRKIFTNMQIDERTGELMIGSKKTSRWNISKSTKEPVIESVTCSGCGAANQKQKGVSGNCEYCGSAIK